MAGNRWDRLATYNAEVHRGIVHTAAYDAEMALEQQAFDAEQATRCRWCGGDGNGATNKRPGLLNYIACDHCNGTGKAKG